jgi:hypothetical protein
MSHEQTAAGSTVGANSRRGGTPRRRVHTHGAGAPASAWPASHIRGALATIYGGGSKARNEDGTPRKRFRSLQHEIMATLDGEQVSLLCLGRKLGAACCRVRTACKHVVRARERARVLFA